MSEDVSVKIRRKKIFAKSTNDEEDKSNDASDSENEELNPIYFQATAILFFVVALALFASLISYSAADESNAKMNFGYLIELLGDSESLKFRAQNTNNWLGLFGAIISYHLYNSTFGIIILLLPYFLVIISIDLFKSKTINDNTLKSILTYSIFSFLFSSLMGTLSQSDLFGNMPKELVGAIGYLVSDFSSSIIGFLGSFLLFSTSLLLTIVLGTRFKLEPVLNVVGRAASDIKIDSFKKLFDGIDFKKNKIVSDTAKEDEVKEPDFETQAENIEIEADEVETEEHNLAEKPKFNFTPLKIRKEIVEENLEDHKNEQIEDVAKEEIKEIPSETEINDPINNISNKISSLVDDLDIDQEVDIQRKNQGAQIEESEEIIEESNDEEPSLVLEVEDIDYSDDESPGSPLSTLIHDEKIVFKNPHSGLLNPPVKSEGVDNQELEMNARILQEKLETFKIHIENLEITPGPVVTQYAFQPAAGIKISRIESLADDLAMALRAKGIRIIAPIPGKGSVGIEIPNNNPTLVTFSSVINSKKFDDKKMYLPISLGKTISGETSITDLAKMPHLLVAGSTGSGKSVGVNTIINTLLFKKSPEDLKFVIIDPKKVELQQYKALKNHYLAVSPDIKSDIVTDPIEAVALLKSTVIEMENRYDILAGVGQRNIADYNEKVEQGKYKDDPDMEHRKMPYIVVIVDEFADLMLTASKEIEEPIVRLAQMARAVGIHLVLATQRPSVDVITGIIKANFPARIAYLVASKIDSRTILDTGGAEQLLGMGDMLFLPSGKPKPDRIQNAFISTDEVEAICDFIGDQKGYSNPYILPSIHEKNDTEGSIAAADRDPLFRDAAGLVIQTQQGSVSLIQRRLKVGYARAGRIMDELEDAGIVGPFEGSKARQVYLESEAELESYI